LLLLLSSLPLRQHLVHPGLQFHLDLVSLNQPCCVDLKGLPPPQHRQASITPVPEPGSNRIAGSQPKAGGKCSLRRHKATITW
jgi:hypothetical protein